MAPTNVNAWLSRIYAIFYNEFDLCIHDTDLEVERITKQETKSMRDLFGANSLHFICVERSSRTNVQQTNHLESICEKRYTRQTVAVSEPGLLCEKQIDTQDCLLVH